MVETALKTNAAERRGVEAGAARAEARPRRTPRTAWALACLAVDLTMLVLAALATSVGASYGGFARAPLTWTLLTGALTLGLFRGRGLYTLRLRLRLLDDVRAVIVATTFAAMIVLSIRVLLSRARCGTPRCTRPDGRSSPVSAIALAPRSTTRCAGARRGCPAQA